VAAFGAEDHLAWEARQRTPAAIAAALAGLLTLLGTLWRGLILKDAPRPGLLDALARVEDPGPPIGPQKSLAIPFFEYYQDHAATVIAASALVGIGSIALGWALTYLAVAVRARRPEFPRILVYLPIVGGILNAIYVVASELSRARGFDTVLSGPATVDAVLDLGADGFAIFAAIIGLPGTLGLALAIVFVSLNGMRTGLLTRFMGVLGMITGALVVIPFGGPLPVVQCFWLLMLAGLFIGRTPGGVPPAWRTGNAEPWPTSAEIREQRQRAAAERRGETWEPPARSAEPVTGGPSPSTSARKRKRKRR
jgi:hypothetical protein